MQDNVSFLDFDPDFSSPRIVEAYDELPIWSALFGVLLLDELPFSNMFSVLDIGCGTGFPLIELAERLGPRSHVHGIDPWAAGLRRAAQKIAIRNCSNVTLHEGTASTLPFKDHFFDLIVSNLGLNNFDDPAVAIRECRRVARAGATLSLTTNLQGHMQEFYRIFEEVLQRASDEAALVRLRDHVEHRATIASVCALLAGAGFVIKRVVERRATMRFADGTALLNHHFIKLGFLDAWKQVVPGRESAVFSALCQALDDHARQQGELRLTIPMAYVEAIAS